MQVIINVDRLENGEFIASIKENEDIFFILDISKFTGVGSTASQSVMFMLDKVYEEEYNIEMFAEHGDNIK